MVAANLAITLAAREGERILLIDGDIFQMALTRMFNATEIPGLTEWVNTDKPVWGFVRRLADLPLFFLPVGQPNEEFALRAEAISEKIEALKDSFDWIIVDSPPLTFLADASAWALAVEKCLVVVRSGVTPKRLLQKGLSSLPPGKLIGMVLNECSDVGHSYYARYRGGDPSRK
jgi:Mrp family chromosome partitioning ATPase